MLYNKPIKNLQRTTAAILLAVMVLFAHIGVVLHTHHCKNCKTFEISLWNIATCSAAPHSTPKKNNNSPKNNACCQKNTSTCHNIPQTNGNNSNNASHINSNPPPCCTLTTQYLSETSNAVSPTLAQHKTHFTAFWQFIPPATLYNALVNPLLIFYPQLFPKKYLPAPRQYFSYALYTKPPPRLSGKLLHIFIHSFLN